MSTLNIILISFGISAVITGIAFVIYLSSNKKIRRETSDPVAQHKHFLRPPTRKFQKLHPRDCPHHNGIYREILDNNQKKTIFVCADCISLVEQEELEIRDKFKAENGRLPHPSYHNKARP